MRVAPSRISGVVFRAKVSFFQARRTLSDFAAGVHPLPKNSDEHFHTLIAEASSDLWKFEDSAEANLQFGKVQNLRCAAREINGIVIPAGRVFSFWKQIGRTTTRKGYAIGRELREGCLIPSLGGGLCQLSNTLYDAALKAGVQIVERHAHSQIVPGSAAALGRDATVFWNYVDFRFVSSGSIYLETFLTDTHLVVRFYGNAPAAPVHTPAISQLTVLTPREAQAENSVNNCFDCGTVDCFRHSPKLPDSRKIGKAAFVLDEWWPEFNRYLASVYNPKDIVCIPLEGTRWNRPSYAWDVPVGCQLETATWATFIRALRARKLGKYGARRLQAQFESAEAIAVHFGRNLPPEVEHVCASQPLLPFLWKGGYLGGRSFDVLLTRLPLSALHEVLDSAALAEPEHGTLSEYRAPDWIIAAEKAALDAAKHVITPHASIQTLFPDKVIAVPWQVPVSRSFSPGRGILFPGPTAARKGAYELRDVARELDLEIVLCGSELEGSEFWSGVRTKRAKPGNLDGVGVIVQPALLEERPRALLSGIANGLPVIATRACGLDNFPQVRQVEFGDKNGLKIAISAALAI